MLQKETKALQAVLDNAKRIVNHDGGFSVEDLDNLAPKLKALLSSLSGSAGLTGTTMRAGSYPHANLDRERDLGGERRWA